MSGFGTRSTLYKTKEILVFYGCISTQIRWESPRFLQRISRFVFWGRARRDCTTLWRDNVSTTFKCCIECGTTGFYIQNPKPFFTKMLWNIVCSLQMRYTWIVIDIDVFIHNNISIFHTDIYCGDLSHNVISRHNNVPRETTRPWKQTAPIRSVLQCLKLFYVLFLWNQSRTAGRLIKLEEELWVVWKIDTACTEPLSGLHRDKAQA